MMKLNVALPAIAFGLFLQTLTAAALEELKLEGTAFLDEESCAKGLGAPECTLSFSITGDAAKTLYDGMKAKAIREECTGGMEKASAGGLHCIAYDDNSYQCDFGYHFGPQEFGGSAMSC